MTEESAPIPTPDRRARGWGVFFAWAIVLGILALLAFGLQQANRGPLEIGKPAPDFVLTTFDRDSIDTVGLRGQVVLVNIWASWCVECVYEAAELEQAYQMFKDRGVVFLGVAWSDTEAKALEYLERHGITYPNGPDMGGRIHKQYRITGVPETFIIDPDGLLSSLRIGPYASLDEIVNAVEAALAP